MKSRSKFDLSKENSTVNRRALYMLTHKRNALQQRDNARRRRAEGFVLPRRTVAAALSAAVTTTNLQEIAPN